MFLKMVDKKGQKGGKQSPPASDDCPCKKWIDDSVLIQCDTCDTWWHCQCVSLKGLTQPMVDAIESYECPRCFTSPFVDIMEEPPMKGEVNCKVLSHVMRKELNASIDILKDMMKEAASNAVNQATPTVVSSVVEKTKSFAAVTEQNQIKLVEEVKNAATSAQLVDKICKKMDNDHCEREKRKSNVIISNVPEPQSDLTPADKKKVDSAYLCKNMDMNMNEIQTCFRTGAIKKDAAGNPLPRPLVVKMTNADCANYWHNHGKGFKIGDSWINPDLCKVDRENQFFARQERRRRQQEAAKKKQEKNQD